MSFGYDLYILCDKCGDFLGDSAVFRTVAEKSWKKRSK